jgi:hypothetical protein
VLTITQSPRRVAMRKWLTTIEFIWNKIMEIYQCQQLTLRCLKNFFWLKDHFSSSNEQLSCLFSFKNTFVYNFHSPQYKNPMFSEYTHKTKSYPTVFSKLKEDSDLL